MVEVNIEGYTIIPLRNARVLTKNVIARMGRVSEPINLTLLVEEGKKSELLQNNLPVAPSVITYSIAKKLMKGFERSIEKNIRSYLLRMPSGNVADKETESLASGLVQILQSLPRENRTSFIIPILVVDEIVFKNRLGKTRTIHEGAYTPVKGVTIFLMRKQDLKEWVKGLEDAATMRLISKT